MCYDKLYKKIWQMENSSNNGNQIHLVKRQKLLMHSKSDNRDIMTSFDTYNKIE